MHGLGFLFCSRRGSNLLFPAHCLLSKKLVAALVATGESGAETIADNNGKTIQQQQQQKQQQQSLFVLLPYIHDDNKTILEIKLEYWLPGITKTIFQAKFQYIEIGIFI